MKTAALLAIVLLLAACAGPRSISLRGEGRIVAAADGAPIATYDLHLDPAPEPGAAPRGTLLYVTGSESESVRSVIGNFAGAVEMGLRVVLAERRGVRFDGTVDERASLEGAAKATRVSDVRAVLDAYVGTSPERPVILFGASEGGDVAAAVAAADPRISHVVLLGCGGGWTQERELRWMIEREGAYLGLRSGAELDAVLARIRAAPDSLELWAGHPFRRWSAFLWSAPADDLRKTRIPVFLAHGTADRNVPVESARALAASFREQGRGELTYVELEGVDHAFTDTATGRSALPRLEIALIGWFAAQGLVSRDEAETLLARVRVAHPE